MNKRQKKKDSKKYKGFFVGHPGSFAYPLWEASVKRHEELLASGLYRKGQKQRKIKARILSLKASMWDYDNRRRYRNMKPQKQIYKHERAKRNPMTVIQGMKFRFSKGR